MEKEEKEEDSINVDLKLYVLAVKLILALLLSYFTFLIFQNYYLNG